MLVAPPEAPDRWQAGRQLPRDGCRYRCAFESIHRRCPACGRDRHWSRSGQANNFLCPQYERTSGGPLMDGRQAVAYATKNIVAGFFVRPLDRKTKRETICRAMALDHNALETEQTRAIVSPDRRADEKH